MTSSQPLRLRGAPPPLDPPPSMAEAISLLSGLPPDTSLLYPVTAQFIQEPAIAGQVDAAWLAKNLALLRADPELKHRIPVLGTPLVKSRMGRDTFPITLLTPIRLVIGERNERHRLTEHLHNAVRKKDGKIKDLEIKLRQLNNNYKKLQKDKKFCEKKLETQKTTIEAMCLGMKALKEKNEEIEEKLEQKKVNLEIANEQIDHLLQENRNLREVVEEKKQEGGIWKQNYFLLLEQVNLMMEKAEMDRNMARELEIKNRELTEQLSIPLVREESTAVIEKLQDRIRELSAPPTPAPIPIIREDHEEQNLENLGLEDMENVKANLAKYKLQPTLDPDIEKNGRSLFQAVSEQLRKVFELEKSPSQLLVELIEYLEEPSVRALFEKKVKLIQNNEEIVYGAFLNSITEGKANEVIVTALSRYLEVTIRVFSSTSITDFSGSPSNSRPSLNIAEFRGSGPQYFSTEPLQQLMEMEIT